MRGYTHILFGALIGGMYFSHYGSGDLLTKFGFTVALIFGALLPDIDQAESTISYKMPKASKFVSTFFKHRGIWHSIWIPVAIFAFVKLVLVNYVDIPSIVFMGLIVGYASHLLSDMMTVQGIKPFHPFHKAKIKGIITTGSLTESVIGVLIIMYLIIL